MDRENERRPSKLQTRGRGYDANGTTIALLLWEEKRFIRIIKELWNTKGYGDLGLSSLNLRDQAARLEKTKRQSTGNLPCGAQTARAQQFIETVWDVVIKNNVFHWFKNYFYSVEGIFIIFYEQNQNSHRLKKYLRSILKLFIKF